MKKRDIPGLRLRFRKAAARDIVALVALEKASFRESFYDNARFNAQDFRDVLANPDKTVLVLVSRAPSGKTGIRGLAGYSIVSVTGRAAEFESLAIAPSLRGRGLGRKFMKAAEDHARRAGCVDIKMEAHETNAGSLGLATACGYTLLPGRGEAYADGTRSIRMMRKLQAFRA